MTFHVLATVPQLLECDYVCCYWLKFAEPPLRLYTQCKSTMSLTYYGKSALVGWTPRWYARLLTKFCWTWPRSALVGTLITHSNLSNWFTYSYKIIQILLTSFYMSRAVGTKAKRCQCHLSHYCLRAFWTVQVLNANIISTSIDLQSFKSFCLPFSRSKYFLRTGSVGRYHNHTVTAISRLVVRHVLQATCRALVRHEAAGR